MFMSTGDYLKRITHNLEHVVAPQIESDFARGQVLAAVFLLDQLSDRIDYKASIVSNEIKMSTETIKKVVETCREKESDVPDDLSGFIEELEKGDHGMNIEFRGRCDKMLCLAIDYFYACRGKISAESAHEIESIIINLLTKIGGRDLGMLKPSTSGKLIQTKD